MVRVCGLPVAGIVSGRTTRGPQDREISQTSRRWTESDGMIWCPVTVERARYELIYVRVHDTPLCSERCCLVCVAAREMRSMRCDCVGCVLYQLSPLLVAVGSALFQFYVHTAPRMCRVLHVYSIASAMSNRKHWSRVRAVERHYGPDVILAAKCETPKPTKQKMLSHLITLLLCWSRDALCRAIARGDATDGNIVFRDSVQSACMVLYRAGFHGQPATSHQPREGDDRR